MKAYRKILWWYISVSLVSLVATELLQNPGFEDSTNSAWICMGGCTLTSSNDAHDGQQSVKVTERRARWMGPAQDVDLEPGSRYKMTGYVKFLTTKNSQPSQEIGVMLKCRNSTGTYKYYTVGNNAMADTNQWTEVGGEIQAPFGSSDCRFYFQTDVPASYLLDTTSLTSLELLKNPNLEITDYTNNWLCMGGCTLTPSNDAHNGYQSVKVSNRKDRWEGAAQDVNLNAGSYYRMTGFIKFLTTKDNKPYQAIGAVLKCTGANGKPIYSQMGGTPRAELGQWHEVGDVVQVPEGATNCRFYFQTDYPADYLLDTVSLEEVYLSPNWKTEAESTIEDIRKAATNIRLSGTGIDFTQMEYEIKQTGNEFIWGSAVRASEIVDPDYSRYQQVFNDNFEWAVLENSLKWDQMERIQGIINYNTSLTAIQKLLEQGKKVRGHCTFWSVDNFVQNWVKGLSDTELENAISTRIQGVIGETKDLLEHWDVNNENQHGAFYEQQTGDVNITMDMFRQVNNVDGNAKLYLNDYQIISSSWNNVAVATKDQADRYLRAGIPLHGIGVQGHMSNIDLPLIKARLDLLAETGLPILITELDVDDADVNSRASKLSDLLYMFFSHPAVEGVLVWGFWDQKIWKENTPLFNGDNITANAAGEMYQILRQQWSSQASGAITNDGIIDFRGFKGSYSLTIKRYGEVVATQTFDLTDSTGDLELQLDLPVLVVRNPGFESTDYSDNWYCRGQCTLTSSDNAHTGQKSVLVINRSQKWHGLAQVLDLTPDSRYRITAYVNLVNTKDDSRYQEVGLSVGCTVNGETEYVSFGKTPRAEPGEWYEIGGAERIPEGSSNCFVYVVTEMPSDYLIDSVTAEELIIEDNWITEANNTIDEIRKADITINVNAQQSQLNNLEYELVQTSHEYIWGSAVTASYMLDANYTKYQETFYENFEWGVMGNALKWSTMERKEGIVKSEDALAVIDLMRQRGKKVRGHCVFWAVDKWVQDWVQELSGPELEEAIETRIQGVIPLTKGLVEHWDVNNENQHGDYYGRTTGKTNITMDMFEQIHELDNDVRLYLNDYAIISSSTSVVANKDQAVRMVQNNIPISGVGVQGHLWQYDLTLIKGRLDILAEAGLPILITELGVNDDSDQSNADKLHDLMYREAIGEQHGSWSDCVNTQADLEPQLGVNDDSDQSRADKLHDLMYLFFSHRSVEGLVIWGFWDGRIWEPNAPLFNGPNVEPNAAGDVYLNLRKQWTTDETGSFNGGNSVTIRGFKGDYSLRILQDGNVVSTQTFQLTDGGTIVNVSL